MQLISYLSDLILDKFGRMATFLVDDVEKAKTALPVVADIQEFISRKLKVRPESWCKPPKQYNLTTADDYELSNSFVAAVHTSYDQHYPLVLTPDIIWQCVAQGFAIHVNKNAEKLRHMFVAHEGKKTIEIQEDTFIKGSPDNNWEGTFSAFSDGIRKHIGGEIHDLLTPDFSTTGPVEKAAAQVVLMDTFKEYFKFIMMTHCGIPSVTLEGSVDDWKKLREKTLSLSRFDLQWWTDAVNPILSEFVDAVSGKVNRQFWQTMYKKSGGSGGPFISGWIVTLFPYLGHGGNLKNMKRNSILKSWNMKGRYGMPRVTTSSFPNGTVSTPFVWKYFNEESDMFFYAGFLGIAQDKDTLALRPMIGWAVVGKEEEEKAKLEMRRGFEWW